MIVKTEFNFPASIPSASAGSSKDAGPDKPRCDHSAGAGRPELKRLCGRFFPLPPQPYARAMSSAFRSGAAPSESRRLLPLRRRERRCSRARRTRRARLRERVIRRDQPTLCPASTTTAALHSLHDAVAHQKFPGSRRGSQSVFREQAAAFGHPVAEPRVLFRIRYVPATQPSTPATGPPTSVRLRARARRYRARGARSTVIPISARSLPIVNAASRP